MAPAINPGTSVASLNYDLSGQNEVTKLSLTLADTGVFEVQTLTFPATAGATQGDFVVVENAAGTSYAVWLDIDAAGTEPSGAVYTAADNKIEVDIVTGDTAAQVGTKVFTAIDGNITNVTAVDNEDGTVTLTQTKMGDVTAPNPSNSAENGAGSITGATNTAGAASNYNSKYITLESAGGTAFYCWLSINSEGSDPSPGGTALAATGSAGDSAATLAMAIASAINGNANFDADHEGSGVVRITAVDAEGNATDVGVGNMPSVTVQTQFQGDSALIEPGGSPSDLSNNPSVL